MADQVNHVPPQPGVTEVRVHGVGGANPASMLGRTDVYQVTGDGTAGLFRATSPPEKDRTVEAYSWGGLTAGSKTRALWVLLLPFALVNLAGWMVDPKPEPQIKGKRSFVLRRLVWVAQNLSHAQRALMHLTALAVTGAYVMWTALGSVNLLAYQCGGRDACAEGRFFAEFFRNPYFADHPGRRIVVGALVPLLLLALFAIVSLVSRARYESFTEAQRGIGAKDPEILTTKMDKPGFWRTNLWHTRLFRIHLAVALLFLGGLIAYATTQFTQNASGTIEPPGYVEPWSRAVFWATVVMAIAAAVVVIASVWVEASTSERTLRWLDRTTSFGLAVSAGLTLISLVAAWQLQGDDAVLMRNAASSDLWGFGWAPILLFAGAVFCVLLFSLVEVAKWTVTCQVAPAIFFIAIAGVLILAWPYAPIVLLIALGIAGFARYAECKLCNEPSEIPRWIEVGAATLIMVAIQWFGHERWEGTVWGDDWPRLTPVLLSTAVLMFFFYRYTGPKGESEFDYSPLARVAPLLAAGVLGLVGVVMWQVLGRLDPIYLAVYVAWLLASFFWVAVQPHHGFRWNGPGAVALLAISLTAGLFAGGLIRFERLLTREGYRLRSIELYDWIVVGFVSICAAAIVALLAWFVFTWRTRGKEAEIEVAAARRHLDEQLPADETVAPATVAGRVRNWVTVARGIEAVDVFIMHISMAVLFASMALVLHFRREGVGLAQMVDQPVGSSWDGLVSATAWVTLMIVLGAVLAVRSGLRDAGFRRQVGIVWDVTSFWPRHFHPFAPPSYAVRTVPELQERMTEIAAGGAGATILSGHSQGSVVAFAAAASLDDAAAAKTVLVTHGSPLRRFYARFFPSYFTNPLLIATAAKLSATHNPADGSWLNFHRDTDPIALPIFGPLRAAEEFSHPPAPMEQLKPALGTADLPDVRLDDPSDLRWAAHRRPPEVMWHLSYMADPTMADAVTALAGILKARL